MYFLGLDIGSSSVKVTLLDGRNNQSIAQATAPDNEMGMLAVKSGWAEQEPMDWWTHVKAGIARVIQKAEIDSQLIGGIGIAYQMHGLVIVDKHQEVLRPSIIWCDSRAVPYGQDAFLQIGEARCLAELLNAPGNFTAAKLKWVKENEPEIFAQIDKIMLPGDFIAMKFTGKVNTTVSGLSEGVFWDFRHDEISEAIKQEMGFSDLIFPEIVPTFGNQGQLSEKAAGELGLKNGIAVGYRAGDQPNNALALGALEPGEVAATGGTSGVIYGVLDQPVFDQQSRVNCFAHVNHKPDDPRIGVLLCINGTGIQYRWIKDNMAEAGMGYGDLEKIIQDVPAGSDGLLVIPFGNGAERVLGNKDIGANYLNVQFNRHSKQHFYRAALEGIAYSFKYGVEIMHQMGMNLTKLRVGNDNLFQSEVFSQTVSTLLGVNIEIVETNGALGAARGAAYGLGYYKDLKEAVGGNQILHTYQPKQEDETVLNAAYAVWKKNLSNILSK